MKKNLLPTFILILTSAGTILAQDFQREIRIADPRMSGKDIAEVQSKLLSFGFSEIGTADGWYGPKTEAAVKRYQQFLGFIQNGVVDQNLWKAMFSGEKVFIHINADLKAAIALLQGKHNKTEQVTFDYSTEGGQLTRYSINGSLKYLEVLLTNSMWKVYYRIYPIENRQIVTALYYFYPAPFDQEHAELAAATYYLREKQTYEIRNGQLSNEGFDKDIIAKIIDKELK